MSAEPVSTGPAGLPESHREEAFRRLVETVHDYAIMMLSPDGRLISWNIGAQRMKGYQAHEIIGRHISTFYPEEAKAAGWPDEELRRAAQAGHFEDEGWRIRKDGTRFWANVIITALRGPAGELIGFSKITRDLSERRQHEQRLKESEESLRLLVEGVQDHAIFQLDAHGAVQSWNAGAERVLGYTDAEVMGHSAAILYTEEDRAAGRPQLDLEIARSAGSSQDTGWRVRGDGSRFWADVTITVLRHRDGALRGFTQIMHDLSERRRVQELETEGKRINEFIAMLAHELRNPLAPIGNAVGIMQKTATTPDVVWCAQLIGRQVAHLARLVDDLLDVSRITSGKFQLRMEPLDLCAVTSAALESVRAVVEGFGHALDIALPPQPVAVVGDPTRLTQVLVNLVTNAAKYTLRGGRVQVRLMQTADSACLEVEDNGIGMPPHLVDTAFDLFVQGERGLDRSEGGLGIGLTLVKRIVKMHGGDVAAASEGPGKGSRFSVILPLAPQEAAPGDA